MVSGCVSLMFCVSVSPIHLLSLTSPFSLSLLSLSLPPTCGHLLSLLNHHLLLPRLLSLSLPMPRLLSLSIPMLHCCLPTTLLLLSLLTSLLPPSFLPRSSPLMSLSLPPRFSYFHRCPSHSLYIDLYIPSCVLYSDHCCMVSQYTVLLISASDLASSAS